MDPTNNKASDFERRASRRVSARLSLSAGDHRFAEEEENDAVLGLGIADGFRPVSIDRHQTPTPERASTSSGSSGSGSGEPSTPPRSLTSIRPSSIAKPPQHQDPFALRHDGGMGQVQETPLSRHSSTTTSTDATIVREESPYEGPSGPSFPYQMYPQNVRVARTLSVTTASTAVQSESSYQGPRGPSHPYGIYHQNTITPPSAPPPTNIPVGFPGMRDNYQRRLGPDGEDAADLIGPDGHTEQLPPYTRYPDEAYTRKAGAAADAPPAPATVLPIPGAGGIGLAARNPEFDELDTPRSRLSSRSFTSDISHHEINTAADVVNEKRSSRRSYQQYAKRRIGGIVPCWAVCLVVSGLVLMGIILGAVVGSFLVKHNNNTVNRPPPPARLTPNPVVTSVTITVDATPIPTPSDIPPLPLGTYVLPLITNKTPNSCFKDPSQSQAWSCNIALPFSSPLMITIDPSPPSSNSQYIMSISANESNLISNGLLPYGTQPPLIRERVHLELVNDTMEPSRGPAWFELIHYNKTVVMKESFLGPLASSTSPSSSAATAHAERRRFKTPSFEDFHRKSVAQPGEKPWVCTWPDTVLEVFIFPNQNTSLSRLDLGSSSSTTSTTAPGGYPTAKPDGYYSAKGFPAPGAAPTPTTPADAAVTTPPSPPAPPYPRFVKVEERHMDYAPQAECVQFEVPADGGRPRPYKNPATGKIVKIEIEDTYERHDIALHRLAPGAISNNLVGRDSVQLSDCGCLWYVT